MRKPGSCGALAILILLAPALPGQAEKTQDPTAIVTRLYAEAVSAVREARDEGELRRAADLLDAPEWVSIDPSGRQTSREQALSELRSILEIPVDKRPVPKIHPVWVAQDGVKLIAVVWAYGSQPGRLTGSLVRDTFVRGGAGWRRIRHEKLFPARPLLVEGNPVVLPPAARE